MPDKARQLRQSIARFERLLHEAEIPELAETYRAEIAAAKAMLAELECGPDDDNNNGL